MTEEPFKREGCSYKFIHENLVIHTKMIYTSNYSKNGNTDNTIAISLTKPSWYKGKEYSPLIPDAGLILAHKSGIITNDEYINQYAEHLMQLDPLQISEELDNKILLCWCGTGKFCHRHIVARWLKDCAFVSVREL